MARPSLIQIAPDIRFGRLTVIDRAGLTSSGGFRWKCRCDCGNITYLSAASLRNGTTKSCGCLQKEIVRKYNAKDITGQRFGRLTALHRTGESRNGKIIWRCRCDCGQEIESSLGKLGTDTKSCGCLHCEQVADASIASNEACVKAGIEKVADQLK
jgi:hypothetical protein